MLRASLECLNGNKKIRLKAKIKKANSKGSVTEGFSWTSCKFLI